MKVWSGSAWAEKPAKVWSGTAWVTKPVKVWDGVKWVVRPPTVTPPSGWTPAELSAAMFAWWDPSVTASLTFSGANLLEMADQSPANHKIGRAASSGPIATTINGLGALQYAPGQGIATPATPTFNDFTATAVFKPGNTVADYERVVDHAYATGWWIGRTGNTETWGGGVLDGPGTGYGQFVSLPNNQVHQISSLRIGDKHTISGNGGASLLTRAVTAAETTAQRVTIADDQGNLSPMTGIIAEVLVWSTGLTLREIARVEGYLAHKWGIQDKLPAGHPYKSAPPQLVPPDVPSDWTVISFTPGPARDDFSGEVGVRIMMTSTRSFTWVGKMQSGGNTGLHRVRVYEWFADAVVAEGMVDMTGVALGGMGWVKVPAFTLLKDGYYSILYQATAYSGQPWANPGPVTMQAFIGNIYSTYRVPGSGMTATGPGETYVGVDIGW